MLINQMTLKFATYLQDELTKMNQMVEFLNKTYQRKYEISLTKQMILQNDNKFYKEVVLKVNLVT
jgi:hypothetical protein